MQKWNHEMNGQNEEKSTSLVQKLRLVLTSTLLALVLALALILPAVTAKSGTVVTSLHTQAAASQLASSPNNYCYPTLDC